MKLFPKKSDRSPSAVFLCLLVLSGALAEACLAQELRPMQGFRYPLEFYPDNRLKTQIIAEEVIPSTGQEDIHARRVRVESFDTEGVANGLIRADDCRFSREKGMLWSDSNVLLDRDGIRISGKGFAWTLKIQKLILRQDVEVVFSGARQTPSESSPSVPGLSTLFGPGIGTNQTRITAVTLDFDYRKMQGVFEKRVLVKSGETQLSSDKLTASFAGTNELRTVEAEGNVEILYSDGKGLCRRAAYEAETGLLILTGGAVLHRARNTIAAERIAVGVRESAVRTMKAVGKVRCDLDTALAPGAEGNTGKSEVPAEGGIPGKMIRPSGPVSIECDTLIGRMGGSNELQSIEADGRVAIRQGDGMGKGRKVTYDGTTGVVTLTGDAVLRRGDDAVTADRIIFQAMDGELRSMDASGKVRCSFANAANTKGSLIRAGSAEGPTPLRMDSNRLIAAFGGTNGLESVDAIGDVRISQGEAQGTGQRASHDTVSGRVVLSGSAELNRPGESVSAETISFVIRENDVRSIKASGHAQLRYTGTRAPAIRKPDKTGRAG